MEATRSAPSSTSPGSCRSAPAAAASAPTGGSLTVTDGPFAESKELISYAVYDVRSREEAMEWAAVRPAAPGALARLGGRGRRPAGLRGAARAVTGPDARRTAETVWRMESASVVAVASRVLGDVGLGEEVAQDAFVAALEQWPSRGVPPNPAGWLVSTARHQAIDLVRRRSTYARKLAEVGRTVTDARLDGSREEVGDVDDLLDDNIGDDLLRLVFTTCHPVLTEESRVALTLRLLGGLTTAEVARGLLIPEATAGQRISRAKRTLAVEGVSFELPQAAEMPERLGSVLEVVYLMFNEGYVATSGPDWARPELCHEAIRLARLLASLLPAGREVLALEALLELQASRLSRASTRPGRRSPCSTRTGGAGTRCSSDGDDGAVAGPRSSRAAHAYLLQASIAACRPRAVGGADRLAADRPAVRGPRRRLPVAVVELNRAVAVGMAGDPLAGLALVDAVAERAVLAATPRFRRSAPTCSGS